jgi:S-adenosylmethionine hydrolase
MGIGERELQVGDRSGVSGRRNEHVGIFEVPHNVPRTEIGRAGTIISYRLRYFTALFFFQPVNLR